MISHARTTSRFLNQLESHLKSPTSLATVTTVDREQLAQALDRAGYLQPDLAAAVYLLLKASQQPLSVQELCERSSLNARTITRVCFELKKARLLDAERRALPPPVSIPPSPGRFLDKYITNLVGNATLVVRGEASYAAFDQERGLSERELKAVEGWLRATGRANATRMPRREAIEHRVNLYTALASFPPGHRTSYSEIAKTMPRWASEKSIERAIQHLVAAGLLVVFTHKATTQRIYLLMPVPTEGTTMEEITVSIRAASEKQSAVMDTHLEDNNNAERLWEIYYAISKKEGWPTPDRKATTLQFRQILEGNSFKEVVGPFVYFLLEPAEFEERMPREIYNKKHVVNAFIQNLTLVVRICDEIQMRASRTDPEYYWRRPLKLAGLEDLF